jgi:hypothetical protein
MREDTGMEPTKERSESTLLAYLARSPEPPWTCRSCAKELDPLGFEAVLDLTGEDPEFLCIDCASAIREGRTVANQRPAG